MLVKNAINSIFLYLIISIILCFSKQVYSKNECQKLEKLFNDDIETLSCHELRDKLGQLFYVYVNDIKYKKNKNGILMRDGVYPNQLNPYYNTLIKDLKIGGVILEVEQTGFQEVLNITKSINTGNDIPLFIGEDRFTFMENTNKHKYYVNVEIGTGRGLTTEDYMGFKANAILNYFKGKVLKESGINNPFGPIIDFPWNGNEFLLAQDDEKVFPIIKGKILGLKQSDLFITLKHFPYIANEDPHIGLSRDMLSTKNKVYEKIERFREFSNKTDLIMTTHSIIDSIDNKYIVTFSKKWIQEILRNEFGFKGIILTDGLCMLDQYKHEINFNKALNSETFNLIFNKYSKYIFDLKFFISSLLAGHDMIMLEGNALRTRKVFEGVLAIASLKNHISQTVKTRIIESYNRIIKIKKSKQQKTVVSWNTDELLNEASKTLKKPREIFNNQHTWNIKNNSFNEIQEYINYTYDNFINDCEIKYEQICHDEN